MAAGRAGHATTNVRCGRIFEKQSAEQNSVCKHPADIGFGLRYLPKTSVDVNATILSLQYTPALTGANKN